MHCIQYILRNLLGGPNALNGMRPTHGILRMYSLRCTKSTAFESHHCIRCIAYIHGCPPQHCASSASMHLPDACLGQAAPHEHRPTQPANSSRARQGGSAGGWISVRDHRKPTVVLCCTTRSPSSPEFQARRHDEPGGCRVVVDHRCPITLLVQKTFQNIGL